MNHDSNSDLGNLFGSVSGTQLDGGPFPYFFSGKHLAGGSATSGSVKKH